MQAANTLLRTPPSIRPTQVCELLSHLHPLLLTVDCILLCMILPIRTSSRQQISNVGCLMTATVAVASRFHLQPRRPTHLLRISSLPLLATCARHPHWTRVLPTHRYRHHLIPLLRTCIRKTLPWFMTATPAAWCPLLSSHPQTTQANRCVRSCRSRPSPLAARRRTILNPALRGSHHPLTFRHRPCRQVRCSAAVGPVYKVGRRRPQVTTAAQALPVTFASVVPRTRARRTCAAQFARGGRECRDVHAASGVEERLSRRLDGMKLSGRSNDDRARHATLIRDLLVTINERYRAHLRQRHLYPTLRRLQYTMLRCLQHEDKHRIPVHDPCLSSLPRCTFICSFYRICLYQMLRLVVHLVHVLRTTIVSLCASAVIQSDVQYNLSL
ncbi:hypothetical protein EI94DRAFT_976277 [Lactarius quietus]|nr:hypothetical protein EI94DRAFT_976277 [Lactarius quietus]